MSDFVNGKPMKFPYSHMGQLVRFPYRFHWQHSKITRCFVYSMIICAPLFWQIDKAVNSAGNVALWAEKRAHRDHDPFQPLDHRKDC